MHWEIWEIKEKTWPSTPLSPCAFWIQTNSGLISGADHRALPQHQFLLESSLVGAHQLAERGPGWRRVLVNEQQDLRALLADFAVRPAPLSLGFPDRQALRELRRDLVPHELPPLAVADGAAGPGEAEIERGPHVGCSGRTAGTCRLGLLRLGREHELRCPDGCHQEKRHQRRRHAHAGPPSEEPDRSPLELTYAVSSDAARASKRPGLRLSLRLDLPASTDDVRLRIVAIWRSGYRT